jgi:predicted RNA binding protein YcfA (HicA-like mRNA interferase family)
MRPRPLYRRLLDGNVANVAFADMVRLLSACGFELDRVRGSHHVFVHAQTRAIVNLQPAAGRCKPYQARQVAQILERYDLAPEERS